MYTMNTITPRFMSIQINEKNVNGAVVGYYLVLGYRYSLCCLIPDIFNATYAIIALFNCLI